MSPKAVCQRCGKKRMFHEDEMKKARKGKVVCLGCALQEQFYLFMGEVMAGEHKELIELLEQRLREEEE